MASAMSRSRFAWRMLSAAFTEPRRIQHADRRQHREHGRALPESRQAVHEGPDGAREEQREKGAINR